jgi:hypothetical protein
LMTELILTSFMNFKKWICWCWLIEESFCCNFLLTWQFNVIVNRLFVSSNYLIIANFIEQASVNHIRLARTSWSSLFMSASFFQKRQYQ